MFRYSQTPGVRAVEVVALPGHQYLIKSRQFYIPSPPPTAQRPRSLVAGGWPLPKFRHSGSSDRKRPGCRCNWQASNRPRLQQQLWKEQVIDGVDIMGEGRTGLGIISWFVCCVRPLNRKCFDEVVGIHFVTPEFIDKHGHSIKLWIIDYKTVILNLRLHCIKVIWKHALSS